MSAVLQPTDTPSTVGTTPPAPPEDDKNDDAANKKKKSDPIEAAKRLAESRERLRQWMIDPDGRQEARRLRAAATGRPVGEDSLLDRLRGHPVVGVAVEMANSWWTRHPLHPVASFAEDAVREHVAPVVRRHPLAVVSGAFAVGALVVWFRPWRLLSGTARAAGSASSVLLKILGSVPVASLLAAFTAAAKSRSNDDDDDEERTAERNEAVAAQAHDEAVAAEAQAHDEALAPLAGMPDVSPYPQDTKTVH
jgi:hypothetical protein